MAYNKPIPVPQGESDVYWQKAKQGELWLRYCNSCNEAYFFPLIFVGQYLVIIQETQNG